MDYQRVRIEYAGYLPDGTEFDRNRPGSTLELVRGRGTVMAPIMDAAFSMKVGEECIVDVPAQDAYGEYDPSALLVVPRSYIEEGDKLEQGQVISWHSRKNPQPVAVKVASCDDSSVQLDFNHPLAGKDLTYVIRLVEAC